MVRVPTKLFRYRSLFGAMEPAITSSQLASDKELNYIRLRDYDCVGFDLDHTLAKYNLVNLFRVCYDAMSSYLVKEKGYPEDGFAFKDTNFCARGLVLDFEKGNLLKVSDTGYVLRASHGSRMLSDEEIVKEFGADRKWAEHQKLITTVNNIDDRYRIFDNLFDMPTGIVCAHAIDCLDRKSGGRSQSDWNVWPDVVEAINHAYHPKQFTADAGGFFPAFKADPGHFISECSENVKSWLRNLKNSDKKLFLITSSYIDFAKYSLQYILGKDWESYFDISVAFARKPSFFTSNRNFTELDERGAEVPVSELKAGGFYLNGNSLQFNEFLSKLTGKDKPKVLYVGDSMRSDVFPAKTGCKWDTILILDELECEDCTDISTPDLSSDQRSYEPLSSPASQNSEQETDEPISKKSKKSDQVDEKSTNEDESKSQKSHFLTSVDWGSLYVEDGNTGSANKNTCNGSSEIEDTLWAHVIYKYTDVALPSIDSLADINFDRPIKRFGQNLSPGSHVSNVSGFCSRAPSILLNK